MTLRVPNWPCIVANTTTQLSLVSSPLLHHFGYSDADAVVDLDSPTSWPWAGWLEPTTTFTCQHYNHSPTVRIFFLFQFIPPRIHISSEPCFCTASQFTLICIWRTVHHCSNTAVTVTATVLPFDISTLDYPRVLANYVQDTWCTLFINFLFRDLTLHGIKRNWKKFRSGRPAVVWTCKRRFGPVQKWLLTEFWVI